MNPSQSSTPAGLALTSAVSKIKWRILPLFVAMFIINYIDRVNIGFVRSHLSTDLGIGAAAFGLGAGLFFVGYALFEVPSNMLLQRYGARAWLTRIMFTWGLVAACMAFVQSETSFYFMRFLLGVAEAGFFPGVVYYFTQWLPNHERGRAMAVFLSGSAIASILSGPITGALLLIEGGGLHGWQWMFIIEGGASMVFCVVVWLVLDSTPREAKWLSQEQREALAAVIAAEQEQRAANRPAHVSALSLLRDPQIVLFCFIYFAIQLTIYGATFWLPTIIKKMGHFNDFQVGLFNSIPWIVAIAAMYLFAVLAARYKKPQFWVATTLVISAAGMAISAVAGPVIGFVAVCFAGIGFKAASSLFWPIPQAYLDARIAAAVLALINSLGNLGGFFAPATFGYLEQKTGSIQGGLFALSGASLLAAVLVFLARTRPAAPDGGGPAEAAVKHAA
ncbi:MFS transporter [Herbaspirillum seropedicae]|uniref:Permease of the major facilitator superfamily protein n=1 Tax=Herbaspirillum seropedicae (strain SmR1) TaxID=757424 RepID=D8J1Q3_HERSS|nr:MFS transporter [Herbaspirillum seropedicae]ADJ62674.1 permease of the major facilitator superfamily protein [Herbaspirillum seropedicae SmR1]AKN64781.1 MFS transporter [Herbaspirillum seropedicae]NQE31714.1 MFS transporter [Herbaspirillum seropedicae]UMU20722.1 MFS transporter [Herbaspirillum seropedicae]